MDTVIEVKAALDRVAAEHAAGPGLSDRAWTRRIKEELGALGQRSGYHTYGLKDSPECDGGEFMFDLCWLDYGGRDVRKEDAWLERVPLILESEWLRLGDIDDDLQKLLIARADLKVMVFGAKTIDAHSKTVKQLRRWFDEFEMKSPSDRVLLCGWCSDTRGFTYEEVRLL